MFLTKRKDHIIQIDKKHINLDPFKKDSQNKLTVQLQDELPKEMSKNNILQLKKAVSEWSQVEKKEYREKLAIDNQIDIKYGFG